MTISLTEQLDDFYTHTWYKRKNGVADQVFDDIIFFNLLKEKGGFSSESGGRRIEYSLRTGKSPNVAWVQRGDTVNLGDMKHLSTAYYDWRYLADSIVRFHTDDINNTGEAQLVDFANSKINDSKDTLMETLETALFGTDGGDGKVMHGLQDLIPDAPSSETRAIGGYRGDTYDWWRNQAMDGSGLTADTFPKAMRRMNNDCRNNMGKSGPNIIITGQKPFEAYEDSFDSIQRITDTKQAERGFDVLRFKGANLVWSPYCADSRMYFLNTDFLKFVYNPLSYMTMTEWKSIPNQPGDRTAQIMTACNLCTNRRRVHGVIHSLDDTLFTDLA